MSKKNLLPRGFKANAERLSIDYRNKLNISCNEALDGFKLASLLKIKIYEPNHIFSSKMNLEDLIGTVNRDNGWSALTMVTKDNNKIIIHNNLHAPVRQQSNIMHELAHVICDHKRPCNNDNINLPIFMREFDEAQEEEAICLGATLQIPRDGLLWALKNGLNKDEIGEKFIASQQMVTFRINSTGVMRQLKYLNS